MAVSLSLYLIGFHAHRQALVDEFLIVEDVRRQEGRVRKQLSRIAQPLQKFMTSRPGKRVLRNNADIHISDRQNVDLI
jgi:hypothetical protein